MMMVKVVKIEYNWHQFNDGEIAGEDYKVVEIGKGGVENIIMCNDEQRANVYYADKSSITISNLNKIYRAPA